MTPLKWFLVIFAVLAVVDIITNLFSRRLGIVICDGIILLILLAAAFLVSKNKTRRKP